MWNSPPSREIQVPENPSVCDLGHIGKSQRRYPVMPGRWGGGSLTIGRNKTLEITAPIFGECGLRFCRLFTRSPTATAKLPSPAIGAWLEFVTQSALFIGPIGAMLLGSGSRWGFVIGLAMQPFWFYTSFRHRQWGIFLASIFYAFGWALGVYRNFL